MKIHILSRFRVEALDNPDHFRDFLADDLVQSLQDRYSKVIYDPDFVEIVRAENPDLQYHYIIEIRKG